ncbi:MAG: c-type cytochrome [Acidobacteria bacterium]|nr:MAG: c-type cytochrome [Acidobacteriota bacterium]
MSDNHAPQKPSLKSLLGFFVVVLVALYFIYSAFGGEYRKSTFEARFDFNKPAPPGAAQVVDLRPLLLPTPKLLEEGKEVYASNCVPCHGEDGYGNGPRAAGLNPPPRNYHSGKFRYGTSVLTLYHTVTNGSPGTAMPSFVALSPEERMAVVHYVRTDFIPKAAYQNNTPAQLEALATPAASGPTRLPPLNPVPQGPRIPIDVAMQILANQKPAAPPQPLAAKKTGPPPAPQTADVALGRAVYQARCLACHGDQGQGGLPTMMIGSDPYVEVTARPFSQPVMMSSPNDRAAFNQYVLHGLPGRMMPGEGTLTATQLNSLFAYVQQLVRAQQGAPAPTGGKK